MATEKKYLSLEGLGKYDELIKAKIAADDATTLASAKTYADGLANNYEAAGAVSTAKTELEAKITAVEGKADAADAKAATAQSEVDALETLVGTLPEGSGVTSVVAYINKKTEGIATDTALAQLQSDLDTAEAAIDAIEADYLKAADKTELSDAIAAEVTRAKDAEKANADAIDVIEADYLKAADKTTLEASIAAAKKAGDDAQADIDAFMAAAEVGDAAVDTLKEIQQYITSDGAAATTMTNNIAANAQAIEDLEGVVGTIPTEGVTATNVVDYAEELVAAEKTRAEAAESGLDGRLDTLEGKFGSGAGTVESQISTAKQEAIDAAAADATTKANAAKSGAIADAKTYTDTEVGKDRTRLDALEAAKHTHENKTLLDSYTQTEANLADAVSKKHSHANATVLDGITAEKVTAWDKVSEKATQTDLTEEITRAKAAEKANADAIAAFTAISDAEISALFSV